jgi:phosphate starvation-inducible membrane PsiE
MIFHYLESKSITDKKSIVLLLALLSTMSTTGLIALGFFLVMFVGNKVAPLYKMILFPSLIAGIVIAFTTLDFLGDKITSQMDVASTHHNTRFKSAVLDFRDWLENPVLGLGRDPKTRHKGITNPILTHRTNGVSNYLVTYGIFIFLFYFGSIYYAFRKMCLKHNHPSIYALYSLFLIFIVGFSEVFFSLPFFYGLALLHMVIEVPERNLVSEVSLTPSR